MDNVLIVVDDLEAAKAFFIELGLRLEGEQTVEGPVIGRLIGGEGCPRPARSTGRSKSRKVEHPRFRAWRLPAKSERH
jgi:catechol 2,3-dioxygenase-like lactoylglutathione lyase family enzyme